MTNTQANIGTRKTFVGLGERNFEDSGTVQYKCNREPLIFLNGGVFHVGDTLPFDGNSAYTARTIELLRRFWEEGWIKPAT